MSIAEILVDLDYESTETDQDLEELEILEEMEVQKNGITSNE